MLSILISKAKARAANVNYPACQSQGDVLKYIAVYYGIIRITIQYMSLENGKTRSEKYKHALVGAAIASTTFGGLDVATELW
jgi:hypothetical protein